jgi:hypothetical protein
MKALVKENTKDLLGRTIRIVIELSCNLRLNLTGQGPILVDSDRSLTASAACARGPRTPLERVPHIVVTDHRPDALFVIVGDKVVFSGFRLEGPIKEKEVPGGDDRLEKAIRIQPGELDSPTESLGPIRSIEISNMEIFHWSGAGIEVMDNNKNRDRGRLFNTNEGAVTIKNNFIHDNRHDAGNGYGVAVRKGAYALIAQNVFDENRHAIAGGSSSDDKKDFSGYTARDNLILPGGGLHCSQSFGILNCWWTHQIDMHGTDSTTSLGITTSEHCCGTAGETILIQRNTILYIGKGSDYGLRGIDFLPDWVVQQGLAIKIRGNPADKAVVDGNIFKHGNRSDAIAQNGGVHKRCAVFGWPCYGTAETPITKPIIVPPPPPDPDLGLADLPNNAFGVDPLSQLKPESDSCDFEGSRDGKRDLFMATGITWWAKSPVDGQWRYLNSMPERRPQLLLTDINGDGICDVAERPLIPAVPSRRYSKSGTGPWITWQSDPTPD